MPKLTPVVALDRILANLTKQWHEHHAALAQIEAVFSKYGINPANAETGVAEPTVDTSAPAGKKRRRRGKRGKFAQTAEEFVLGVLSGGKMLATKEINAEWEGSGRGASADNTLTRMVKERKLRRVPNKEGRGSRYVVA